MKPDNLQREAPFVQNIPGKFKFIDLFAGIGGMRLPFQELGGECVFTSEWDKHAQKTYLENFGHLPDGDITKIDPNSIPDHDILLGGFPCQPFSQAGHKKGFDETRGTLFFNIARILEAKRPKSFLLENVRHLLKHDDGKTFKIVKDVLENELNYKVFTRILKASDFGLPQHRPRLFIVGFHNKEANFSFPDPLPLHLTMSDILGGACNKTVGYTLRVGGRSSGLHDRRNWDTYLVNGKPKKLSVAEAAKMQGLPNNFVFPVTETQAMKQLGNSVALPVIRAIARNIIRELN